MCLCARLSGIEIEFTTNNKNNNQRKKHTNERIFMRNTHADDAQRIQSSKNIQTTAQRNIFM